MNKELSAMSDEEFLNIIKFHSEQVKDYLENELYEYIAFYIAKGLEYNAIFDDNFERIVNTAMESFDSFQFRNKIDYERIKSILKNKYHLKKRFN